MCESRSCSASVSFGTRVAAFFFAIRDSHFGRSRCRDAVACERETAVVRNHRQCCVEGGRRTVGTLRLPVADRIGGTGDQRDLARKVGRPYCGSAYSPSYPSRRFGSNAWQALQLLLKR
jgi:hypothetical protein